jgi:hypothetical protein
MTDDAREKTVAALHGVPFTIEHKLPTSEEMRAELKRKIDAGEPLGASHVARLGAPVYVNGSIAKPPEYSKFSPSDQARWRDCPGSPEEAKLGIRKNVNGYPTDRKRRNERSCSGKDMPCMPGKSGNCVACVDDD